MILDAPALHVAASIRTRPYGKLRLTLDFPAEGHVRDRVLSALADVIRPAPNGSIETAPNGSEPA